MPDRYIPPNHKFVNSFQDLILDFRKETCLCYNEDSYQELNLEKEGLKWIPANQHLA